MVGFKLSNTAKVLMLWVLIHCGFSAFTANDPGQDLKDRAIGLFNRGSFQEALPLLSKLVYDYPYDYQVKYYLGAALVETGDTGKEAEKNLLLASGSSVPVMVWFYLGRLYHTMENWNSAQRFYNRFRNNADKAGADSLRIDELILLCYDHVNPFKSNKISVEPDTIRNESIDIPVKTDMQKLPDVVKNEGEKESLPKIEKDTVPAPPSVLTETIGLQIEGKTIQQAEAGADTSKAIRDFVTSDPLSVTTPVVSEPGPDDHAIDREQTTPPVNIASRPVRNGGRFSGPEFISFRINERVTYLVEDMFQEETALQEYKAGKQKSLLLDSLVSDLELLRDRYHKTMDPTARDTLGQKILRMESGVYTLKQESGTHFLRAVEIENSWWKDAGYNVYRSYMQVRDSLLQLRAEITKPDPPAEVSDTLTNLPEIPGDTIQVQSNNSVVVENPVHQEEEITFKVQLGICGDRITPQRKKLLDKISKIRPVESYTNEQGNSICTTGNLTSYGDAMVLQNQVRLEGIRDAFVIAWKNGKRIPLPPENLRNP